jgi:flavin-dependent dehydrogenase
LTLARQLHQSQPHLRTLLIERADGPAPPSAFKVGESTIEVGAHYFAQVLGLQDHLDHCHLEKLGLRYFYQSPTGRFVDRPEFGVSRFLPAKSYQVDRGILENYLRTLVGQSCIEIAEGYAVEDVNIGEGSQSHTIRFRKRSGAVQLARARWLVDASGRRRLIQKKLGLGIPGTWGCNASWFRIEGRLDVSAIVPQSEHGWHNRVQESRWHSTTHLMGDGYWAWLIPLSPGNTSVGIVAMNRLHDFTRYHTRQRAMAWLGEYEPELCEALSDFRVLDFLTLKNYSYSSRQVYSVNRWACVGEAAVFADPYYSVGSNMIAFGNRLVGQMLALDQLNALSVEFVEHANNYLLGLNDSLTDIIQSFYPYYGDAVIMSIKTIWDYYIGWTITDPRFYRGTFLDIDKTRTVAALMSRAFQAHAQILGLLRDWAARGTRFTFEYIDYMEDLPTLRELFVRSLPHNVYTWPEAQEEFRDAVQRVEDVAHTIFRIAVEDTMPEMMPEVVRHRSVNLDAISLDKERWMSNGLLTNDGKPRDHSAMYDEIRRLYHART